MLNFIKVKSHLLAGKIIIIAVCLVTAVFVQPASAQTAGDSLFNGVITSYLLLKNALTLDRPDGAKVAARTLFNAINDVPMDKLSADLQKAWLKYAGKLRDDAEHIKGTEEIDHQREHFVKLSQNMYEMLKHMHVNSVDLYYQYCPMGIDGKGATWVSDVKEVSNPYLPKTMPHCGSNKEIIKATK